MRTVTKLNSWFVSTGKAAKCVPQVSQKTCLRTPPESAVLSKYFGAPLVKAKLSGRATPITRKAEPPNFWQSRQWQLPTRFSSISAS